MPDVVLSLAEPACFVQPILHAVVVRDMVQRACTSIVARPQTQL
jgi:hypothetical protein